MFHTHYHQGGTYQGRQQRRRGEEGAWEGGGRDNIQKWKKGRREGVIERKKGDRRSGKELQRSRPQIHKWSGSGIVELFKDCQLPP